MAAAAARRTAKEMDPPPPPVDRLSNLPDAQLDDILNRLTLRDAVRTSAISRAWRRRWESVHGLALSFPDGTPCSAVDSILLRHIGGVSRFAFTLHAADSSADPRVDDWLVALSRRGGRVGVESISINLQAAKGFFSTPLHSSIFSCARLVSLNLHSFSIPPLPVGFAGFPLLRELYLSHIVYTIDDDENRLQGMVHGSPLLRLLYLDEVDAPGDFVIEAPNLQSLTLISSEMKSDWRFGELPCLQYASIDVAEYMQHGLPVEDGYGFLEFLARFSQVRELILNSPTYTFRIHGVPFTFHNLKSLELWTQFNFMHHILLMFSILRTSPNLEILKIKLRRQGMIANPEFLNAQWTDGMCPNLQVVQITSAEGWLPLSFMKLILSKVSLLRTLSVDECPASQDDPLNELLNCTIASAQAQVLFKDKLDEINFDRMKFAEKDSPKERA
ncbi:unnamed protein product [Urochloa decumbens]|uniref:F-box domain-containing protein n=1 Tax=Urochloa decumbens TaxID=240449 RepID=A0ABC8W066_9POAL